MTDSTTPVRQALIDALAAEARRDAGKPVEPEELLDYLRGSLEPEDRRRVEHRLVADPETARQLLDLADLVEAEDAAAPAAEEEEEDGEDEEAADFALEAGWRDLRGRLAEEDEKEPAAEPRRRSKPASHGGRKWQIAAAALFVVAAGLGSRTFTLQQDLRLAERPRAGIHHTLVADRRGPGAGATEAETLPPGVDTLSLEIPPTGDCPTYEGVFEIQIAVPPRAETRLVRQKADAGGSLFFVAPARPGEYSVSLFGCEPWREVERYRFRLAAASASPSETADR